MKKFLILLGVLTTLSGCGKTQTYSFELNHCKTEHSFDTKQEMCNALKDPSQNMQDGTECAREFRYDYFQKECPGQKWDN
jgi:hypothetical protein